MLSYKEHVNGCFCYCVLQVRRDEWDLFKVGSKKTWWSALRDVNVRGGSRAAATSKMERFVIIINGLKPLTIITKRSLLDVEEALDLPLAVICFCWSVMQSFNPLLQHSKKNEISHKGVVRNVGIKWIFIT